MFGLFQFIFIENLDIVFCLFFPLFIRKIIIIYVKMIIVLVDLLPFITTKFCVNLKISVKNLPQLNEVDLI